MSAGTEQIALLTKGVTLPFPTLHVRHLVAIADAINTAWNAATKAWPATTTEDLEKAVNGGLVVQLKLLARQKNRFSTVVSSVARGEEQYNFDGTSLEKRPDLNFYLKRGRHSAEWDLPLHGECKIVDTQRGQTTAKYRDNGVNRFVVGDYGWTHIHAFMIAYVRNAPDTVTALSTILNSPPTPWKASEYTHHSSMHARSFPYLDRNPDLEKPGDIEIVHIWLDGSKVVSTHDDSV